MFVGKNNLQEVMCAALGLVACSMTPKAYFQPKYKIGRKIKIFSLSRKNNVFFFLGERECTDH